VHEEEVILRTHVVEWRKESSDERIHIEFDSQPEQLQWKREVCAHLL
jgi:hypothetical protein